MRVEKGSIIRQVYSSGNLKTMTKGPKDFQTEADRKSQQCIVSSFKKLFPGIKVVAEEENLDDSTVNENTLSSIPEISPAFSVECPEPLKHVRPESVTVWVDPLDGTLELTTGVYDAVTVLIGIAVDGVPRAGIISKPFNRYDPKSSDPLKASGFTAFNNNPAETLDDCIWSIVGLDKVYGLNQMYETNEIAEGRNIVAMSLSRAASSYLRTKELLAPNDVVRCGGAGNKIIKVLTNECDAYINPLSGTKRWDSCAGEALLTSLGGKLTTRKGNNYNYAYDCDPLNDLGLIASMRNHEFYISRLSSF